MRRVDIFLRKQEWGSDRWTCYVQAVTPSSARRIAAALEAEGEQVSLFTHSKGIGRLVYQTAIPPTDRTETRKDR